MNEALGIWRSLEPMINASIDKRTRLCVQTKKMTVTTAPANDFIGVTEAFGTEIFIPYMSALSSATVGQGVWVRWYLDNMATAMAISDAGGGGGLPETPLAILHGGTGATTAPQALENLGISLPISVINGGTGAETKEVARTNLGIEILLWSGTWASGSITVTDTDKYFLFHTVNNLGQPMIGIKYNNLILCGHTYPANGTNYINNPSFRCSFSGDIWTMNKSRNMSHAPSGSHSASEATSIVAIYGLL